MHTVEIPFKTIKRKALREIARARMASPRESRAALEPIDTFLQRMLHIDGAGQMLPSRWDVRCVARRIDSIPDCVLRRYRHAAIHFYMANDPEST